jgi:hypothetical protein
MTTKHIIPMPSDPSPQSYTVTQQALNVIRQLLNSQGWAKGVSDIFVGGKLLAETLPSIDISWVKSDKEILVMDEAARKVYLDQDKAWGEKAITLSLTTVEVEAVVRAFQHNISELVKAGRLGPNVTLYEIARTFQIKDAAADAPAKG